MKKVISGFTIVELLIVIVVIAILAAISVVAYNGVQQRARQSKIQSDLTTIEKAITTGRISKDGYTQTFASNGYVAGTCVSKPVGTDLAALPKTDACWTNYTTFLNQVEAASGVKITDIVDPWGRPYYIDTNEGEPNFNAGCAKDAIGVFANPLNGANFTNVRSIPLYTTSCP